jgi:hypothetical protein
MTAPSSCSERTAETMGTAEWSHCFVFIVLLSSFVVDAVLMH